VIGYSHYTPEFYISTMNQNPVALSDVLMLNSSAISQGNEQFTLLDVEAHRWYFNAIAACYTGNKTSNGTSAANDLATNWAATLIGLMGNSGLILEGNKAGGKLGASAVAWLLASLSTSAANTLLGLIPGGFLIQPFLPSSTTAGALTAAGTAGLLSALEWLLESNPVKISWRLILAAQE
jgi:hypothetical protein